MSETVQSKCNNRARIISVEEFASQFAMFTIIDSRDKLLYVKGHIPQSVHMNWKEWTLEKPNFTNLFFGNAAKWGKVPVNNEEVESRLRELGLNQTQKILVIGEGGGWGEEGRVAWNLLYWGASAVYLLDGGFPLWKDKYPDRLTKKSFTPEPGTFKVQTCPERLAEENEVHEFVKKQLPLLDVRTDDEYKGKRVSGQKRGGHLPGAELIALKDLYAKDGTYITETDLRKRISEKALKSPITYCVGGVRSALLALLIEARLGTTAKNYAGSVWEWSSRPENPLISN